MEFVTLLITAAFLNHRRRPLWRSCAAVRQLLHRWRSSSSPASRGCHHVGLPVMLPAMASLSHHIDDLIVFSAGACGGNVGRPSYAEIVVLVPATRPSAGREQDMLRGLQEVPSRCHPRSSALPMPSASVCRLAPPVPAPIGTQSRARAASILGI
jgi:hypothetical protein